MLTEEEYQRLAHGKAYAPAGMNAVQWLLSQSPAGNKDKAALEAELSAERDAWNDK